MVVGLVSKNDNYCLARTGLSEMSKYAPEGLNTMANIVLQDLKANGEKSYLLIMQLALKTRMHTNEIVYLIAKLARS